MSTVIYCYRIDKTKLWNLVDQVRTWYEKKVTAFHLLRVYHAHGEAEDWEKAHKLARDHAHWVNFQLFDEDKNWLFRVLEHGHAFMNHYEKEEWAVIPVFYNDRADTLEEREANYEKTKWVDKLISKGHYFMIPIVDRNRLDSYFLHKTIPLQAKENV